MKAILKAENISRTYHSGDVDVPALKPCSITCEMGQFTAVIGKSGSGKSTLLRILGTLDRPDEGSIMIDGEEILQLKDKELAKFRRRKIGFVYQDYSLFPEFTAYENIVMPQVFDKRKPDEAEIDALLTELEIDYCKNKYPGQMSGGEQQRVAIARALATHPSVILADEPTGNLDAGNAEKVAKILSHASAIHNQTIIMVTHDKQMADYAYSIKDYVRTDNYREIYEKNLKETISGKLYYNNDVYDYQPWGSKVIYNYMYLLVVVIGVATIAYQLLGYHNQRKKALRLMNQLGVSKVQTTFITAIENALMLIPSGLLGVITAFAAGKGICSIVERKMGIQFYQVETGAVVKGLLSIVIALVLWELVTVLLWIMEVKKAGSSKKSVKKVRTHSFNPPKRTIGQGNAVLRIHTRLVRNNGMFMNGGIRLLYVTFCFVIAGCAISAVGAYNEYIRNNKRPDLIGYQQNPDADFAYEFHFFHNFVSYLDYDRLSSEKFYMDELKDLTEDYKTNLTKYTLDVSYDEFNKSQENIPDHVTFIQGEGLTKDYAYSAWQFDHSKYAKDGNNNIYEGISDEIVDDIQSIPGIDRIQFGSVESERTLTWDNMNYEVMGRLKFIEGQKQRSQTSVYKERYLFETNYVTPSKDTYNSFRELLDSSYVDYEAWARGEQVLVIVNDNPDGEYDDTLKAGDAVNYHYTQLPTFRGATKQYAKTYPYTNAFIQLGMGLVVDEKAYNENKAYVNGEIESYAIPTAFSIGRRLISDAQEKKILPRTVEDEFVDTITYRQYFEPCVSPVAAGVVKLDDSVKDMLKDIVVDYGYYTVIASDEMAKKACDSQNQLMADALKMKVEDLPEDVKCTYTPDQMQVRYTLSSAVSATSNIVEAYCRNLGIVYASNTEEKVIYRSQTINAFLQYGITFLAVFIVALLISAILIKSRFERRRSEYVLMLRLGADRSMILKMCMLEVLRESIWCIPMLPFFMILQLIMSERMVHSLDKHS